MANFFDFLKPASNNTSTPTTSTVLAPTDLETILDAIPDGVLVVNPQRVVTYINDSALILLQLTRVEIINKPLNQIIKIYDQNKEVLDSQYCPIRTDGFVGNVFDKKDLEIKNFKQPQVAPPAPSLTMTTPMGNSLAIPGVPNVQKDAKPSFNLVVKQVKDGPQLGIGAVMIIHDNTVEKQIEAMKLDFVSMAAHELRTPLTSLKGYLSVFTKEGQGKFTTDQMMFLDRMNISTQTLMNLIENLLNVSRVERGSMTVFKEKVDWLKIVRQTVDDYKIRAKDKNIILEFIEPTQPIPELEVDKLRINEVLYNLLANAINYTAPGGSIQVWLDVNQDWVTTHVKDSGEGIPKEAIPNLFTKFFRVAGNLEQGSKGTGLGLYISKSIIDMHKGQIWVNSELGKGSVFSFSLPISKEMHPDITTGSFVQ